MNLAVKYRPKSLKAFIGSSSAVSVFRSFAENNNFPHTLLFTGPSGVGKTTLARIAASRYLRCSAYDVRELNTADFRGIDTVRSIISEMHLAPIDGSNRVWILDECHSLTKDAQQAVLKAIEDTPKHVYFFLATTEPEKLLQTVKTRCVRIDLRPLAGNEIGMLIRSVAEKEQIVLDDADVVKIIACSGGSARAAIGLLNRVINLPRKDRFAAISSEPDASEAVLQLCRALLSRKPWSLTAKILRAVEDDAESVRRSVLGYCQSVLLSEDNPQAWLVIEQFKTPLYDVGKPGLTAAAYACCRGEPGAGRPADGR